MVVNTTQRPPCDSPGPRRTHTPPAQRDQIQTAAYFRKTDRLPSQAANLRYRGLHTADSKGGAVRVARRSR
ncbi:hypothetical protein NDU88_001115 [Pleurodeles waltl]|uniref:Uncharacterized protein n=1 Tax=Pleurodeles waltl TaxID=8319 RepID=A0AAV7VW00_PLEWA|nr:hypothetical protein NDU88_001115 [Pleurodeles waltl]